MGQEALQHDVSAGSELRVEVPNGKSVEITLVEGTAEVFGTELRLGERVTLRGANAAVFSWEGAKLELSGDGAGAMAYLSDETPMPHYLNLHDALEARRRRAFSQNGAGPRICIVGPTDSGKSTLCRMLGSWAARSAWHPVLVDVDIGQGSTTVPGTVSSVVLESPIDIEEGVPLEAPLVYYFGAVTPSANDRLYRHFVERMAAVLEERNRSDGRAAAAGYIINTMGWVDGLGFDLLLHTIEALQADVICVVGQDRLHAQLSRHFSTPSSLRRVDVVQVPRSGGVVIRDTDTRKSSRQKRVRDYFHGSHGQLRPYSQSLPLKELQIFQVGSAAGSLPSSALPIGAKPVSDPLKTTRVLPSDLKGRVLAVTYAKGEGEILSSNVAGFLYVQDVVNQDGQEMIVLLCPRPGPLPGNVLLAGQYRMFLD